MTYSEEKASDSAPSGTAQANFLAPTPGQQIGILPHPMMFLLQTRPAPLQPR